jgi:hypothetical protein
MDDRAQGVCIEVQSPIGYERAQLLVRLIVGCVVMSVLQSFGGLFGALYLLLPVVAAILIAQHTGAGYLERDSGWLSGVLEWVLGLYAYMLFVTDRFPLGRAERALHLQTTPSGAPTLIKALTRLVTSLPHIVLLLVFSILAGVASLVLAVSVLVQGSVPGAIVSFQRGLLEWAARVLVYHASLSEAYPRFSLGGPGAPPTTPPAEAAGGSVA